MRISDWSSDVCSSDLDDQRLALRLCRRRAGRHQGAPAHQSRQSRPLWLLAATDARTDRLGQDPGTGPVAVEGPRPRPRGGRDGRARSEEHTSELQSLMRISYAVFCLKKKNRIKSQQKTTEH